MAGNHEEAASRISDLIQLVDRFEPKNHALYYDVALAFARLVRDSSVTSQTLSSMLHLRDPSYPHTVYSHMCTHIQAGGHRLVLQQTMTLVERAISLAPLNSVFITLTACKAWVELTTARISRAVRIYGNDCTRH